MFHLKAALFKDIVRLWLATATRLNLGASVLLRGNKAKGIGLLKIARLSTSVRYAISHALACFPKSRITVAH